MGFFNGALLKPWRWFSSERGRVLYGPDGYPLSLSVDQFGRLRVGEIDTIFDSKQVSITPAAMQFTNKLTGGGTATYNRNKSCTTLQVSTAGDEVIRQTRRYFNYQPSKGLFTHQTFAPRWQPGITVEVGYNDDRNGVIYRINDAGASIVLRTDVSGSVVDTSIPQASWNRDPLDSRGPSGITLDRTKAPIFFSALAWLGVGDAALGFQFGNQHVIVHQFEHSNVLESVYMRTPDLPLRWRIYADSTPDVPAELDAICCSVGSEGGAQPNGVPRGDHALGVTCAPGVATELMSGRLNGNPAITHATVYPTGVKLKNASNTEGRFYICYNPTYATGTPTWRSPIGLDSTAHAQINEGPRTIATPTAALTNMGHILYTDEFGPKSSIPINLGRLIALGTDVDGVPDEIAIIAINTGAAAADIDCYVSWVEL